MLGVCQLVLQRGNRSCSFVRAGIAAVLLGASGCAAGCVAVPNTEARDDDQQSQADAGSAGAASEVDAGTQTTAGTGGTNSVSDASAASDASDTANTVDASVEADAGVCLEQTAPCDVETDCCEGLSCDMTWLGRVCCGVQGGSCATENGEDCCGDLLCVDGECVPPPDTCQPTCLPLDWLADVLRDAGLSVVEDPSWLTRGHGYFSDLWGVVAHHTGGGGPNDWVTVRDGTPALAGPLSQLVLEKSGTYRVVASGVAWHAGQGSYPGLPDNDANFYTIGIEAVNSGSEGWSDAQYNAYVTGCAAIMRHLGYDASRVIGHKEWAVVQGKWDPGGIDMDTFRADIQAELDQ